jgi:hypothetical protein
LTQPAGAQAAAETARTGRFAVVAFPPDGIIEDLRKVRAWCPRSGVPVMDCHVPLSDHLESLPDPSAALARLREAVEGFPAFTVRTTEPSVLRHGERADVVLPLEESAQLDELRRRVGGALGPLAGTDGQPRRRDVVVVEEIDASGVGATLAIIAGWRLTYAWVVRDLNLVGLERGALWRLLGRLDFGRP